MNKKKNKKNKTNKNQKSFYFEDYIEDENIHNKNYNFIQISLNRIIFVSLVFLSLIFIFSIKIFYLSISKDHLNFSNEINYELRKNRRDITDNNNNIIAINVDSYSAGIRPQLVANKKKLLLNLKIIFPEIDIEKIKVKLDKNKFFYIKRRLTQDEKTKLWLLGHKAIEFPKRQIRIYPQKNLFSHVIGQIDEDNNGISGIEKYFDYSLKNKELINSSLQLTINSNLQYIIREELLNSHLDFYAVGSAAILMDVDNGEILSLVSLPDYDLNRRFSINDDVFTNKITKGVYELGSVFKTFTLAAALESNLIDVNTVFENIDDKIFCSHYLISEHGPMPRKMSAEQIVIRSSNIGAVRIAQKIGIDKYRDFLNSLELFSTIDFELEEVGTPLPFRWGKCKLATASFGHGITTTPLQLARAYAVIANGGYKIQPTLIGKGYIKKSEKEKIISSKTSNQINSTLRKVVSLDEGTANFADIKGYEVGGKTGTAVKYNSNKKLNTFVSLFPISKPKYVLLVMLDEPKPAPNYVYKLPNGYKHKGERRNTSGWNTVVTAGKIIEKIGPILAINNLQASSKF